MLVIALIGGLLNRMRGGWYDNFKLTKHIPHGVWRILVSLFATYCLYLPFIKSHMFFTIADCIWFLTAFGVFFGLGIVQGWGSWFTIGRTTNSYNHNSDWILSEWLAFKVYGAKWVPWKESGVYDIYLAGDEELLKRFNYVKSPTGEVRPFKWRRNMELFAMNIRGLNITLPITTIYGLHMYFAYGYELYWLLALAPTGYLLGHIYEIRYRIKKKLPSFLEGNTQLGEFISGATLMSSFLFIGSWLALILK